MGQLTSLRLEELLSSSLDFSPLSRLTQLQHLELSSSAEWGCHSFSRLSAAVLQRLSSLQHLHLGSGCGIERSAEAHLAQLTRLTHLWLLDLRVEGATAEAVLPLPQLRELGCAYITGPAGVLGSALLPQLTQLCVGELHVAFSMVSEGDEDDVPPYFQVPGSGDDEPGDNGADGEVLGAAYDDALRAAYELCSTRGCLLGLLPLPQLQHLEVSVDDDDWAPLATELAQQTSLTSLSVRRPVRAMELERGVDLEPLAPALQELHQLQHLTCAGAWLKEACWRSIACMSQLQSLELERCSLEPVHASLLHRCPALEEISLVDCRGVENDEPQLLGMLVVKGGLRTLVFKDASEVWDSVDIYHNDPGFQWVQHLARFLGVQLELRLGPDYRRIW